MHTPSDGATPAKGFVLNRLEPLLIRAQDEGLDLFDALALAYLLGMADGGVKLALLLEAPSHLS